MPSPHTNNPQSQESSSDWFSSDPGVYVQALDEFEQSLAQQDPQPYADEEHEIQIQEIQSPSTPHKRTHGEVTVDDLDSHTYGASTFGGFGEYMARKRAKLQIQNQTIPSGSELETASRIFRGIRIYVDGFTIPSVQELRRMVIEHGGEFHAYLDRKSLVTHIITSSLTPAKIAEFQRMKIVTPEWLVESVKATKLLPWRNYIFRPEGRALPSKNTLPAQQILFNSKIPVTNNPTTGGKGTLPSYAAHESNPNAARVIENPEWRTAHTSAAPDFIDGYYKHSRLHHLSTWKTELRKLVQEAQKRAEKAPPGSSPKESVQGLTFTALSSLHDAGIERVGSAMKSPSKKGKEKAHDHGYERVIMHCDFDAFFVSAGLLDRKHLRGKPVVVCHSQGDQGGASSTSEIASASYEARKFGIKNGMSLQQARQLCSSIQTIPYEFDKYRSLSLKFYTILMSYADDLEAVSVDEALIDVTSIFEHVEASQRCESIKAYAESIRAKVREETGCEVSIGISWNIILSRIATRKAKPANSFLLVPEDLRLILDPLDIKDLHGFGNSTKQKAMEKLRTSSIRELVKKPKGVLCDALGKGTGEMLYNVLRGMDERKLVSDKPRKSVSCDVNYGIRFQNDAEVDGFMHKLSEEVHKRLKKEGLRGRSITLKLMKRDPSAPVEAAKFMGHGTCDTFNKQSVLVGRDGGATDDPQIIAQQSLKMLRSLNFDPKELRGIGIQVQKLEKSNADSAAQATGQSLIPFKSKDKEISKGEPNDKGEKEREKRPITAWPVPVLSNPIFVSSGGPPAEIRLSPPPIVTDLVGGTAEIESEHTPITALVEQPAGSFNLDLPPFSQVDFSVFKALPEDVRRELEAEYSRRSAPPVEAQPAVVSTTSETTSAVAGPSRLPAPAKRVAWGDMVPKNSKRIVQQLAPKRGGAAPQKDNWEALNKWLEKPKKFKGTRVGPSHVVYDALPHELRSLGIDPEVFNLLPPEIRREQLSGAKIAVETGVLPVLNDESKVIIKPKKTMVIRYPRLPPPEAKYLPQPILKMPGEKKGQRVSYTEANDIQGLVEKWVTGFRRHPPNQKDVERFSKWLLSCMDGNNIGDVGMEKAARVMKWWLFLLRRNWGWLEGVEEFDLDQSESDEGEKDGARYERKEKREVGRAWWVAFLTVKKEMDTYSRKRFGGCISLR